MTAFATSTPEVSDGFDECRKGAEAMANHATTAQSHLLAMQPFAPFNHQSAERLLQLIANRLDAVAGQLEAGVEVGVDEELIAEIERWRLPAGSADVTVAVRDAFAMPTSPIDDTGGFRPEWVLGHYAYRTHDLLPHLFPHLTSLGIPQLTDVLAAVTIVGEVLSCNDPVTAYVEMDATISHLLAADPETSAAVRRHLERMEPAMRRARSAAARSSQTVRDPAAETEARANALADSYKRLVEGPFRQFAWALFCLNEGAWQEPPTLGPLRDRLIAAGGGLSSVTADVVIPEFRNGEAHETLVWDGFAEQFVTDDAQISPQQVVASAQLAQCFVAGCEAGLAAVRFLDLPEELPSLPDYNEPGRMPTWRRVQAFFGTNRLILLDASLNTRAASLRVVRLGFTDVNPCLQALVLSHRLMPNVESFTVGSAEGGAAISVNADALRASMLAWEFAVANLDQIPLSTFLPANLDARRRHETDNLAIRSVAWIAVDDAVGVIDGSEEVWDETARGLIDTRLQVVELAVRCTEEWLGAAAPRLRSVASSVAMLREWVVSHAPAGPHLADRRGEMVRLRLQWESWGPVPRHPLVPDQDTRVPDERQPRLRGAPGDLAFRTL